MTYAHRIEGMVRSATGLYRDLVGLYSLANVAGSDHTHWIILWRYAASG
jgi:hypothetical protein